MPTPMQMAKTIALFPLVLLSLVLLVGCAGTSSPTSRVTRSSDLNLSGFPPEYRKAFDDGCERARAGGRVSEAPSFKSSPAQVVQGWRDGFDICRKR